MLRVVDQDRCLHIHPLGDEASEHLRLDRVARCEVDCIGAKLNRPFNDAAAGFLVVEDVTAWVLSDYCYVVGIKVVVGFPRCDQDGI